MKPRTGPHPEEILATAQMAEEHGLSSDEYVRLQEILGRDPNLTELGITSSLWSEHCSYKSSKVALSEFPTEGEYVLHGPGENAGVVEIGNGWVAAFKMESHNHPSYIEPYQGAATGVGGILRDVFTMGARPVACLNALRFGDIDAPRMRYLVDGVVRGVGDYGNCVGVPTVGGETNFHRSYNGNILVNAFALGLARQDRIFTAKASGVGNPLYYLGSRTGRDGIHGATMASESFDQESEAKRPTVQVGDPFTEKVLLEACLEVMRTKAVVAIQDMGAAGLTSSSFEMASSGGTGFELHLDKIPLREQNLSSYEILLSESQERMLLVAERGREEEVIRVFERWGLEASRIGEVTGDGMARIYHHGRKAAEMPIKPITEGGLALERPESAPTDLDRRWQAPEVPILDATDALERLLDTPELGSKSWIWRQYDHTVRSNTVIGPGGDAAVILLKGTPAGLGLVSDVNPVYCALDPRTGGRQAVAEAVRNLACVGAEPVGLTDCLNFGNPENPEVNWQFRECVRGMSEACRALEVPVVSGNVSFYNETEGQSIHPTPTVAMVGLIPNLRHLPESYFRRDGDRIILFGGDDQGRDNRNAEDLDFGGSAYLRLLFDIEAGRPPQVDLTAEEKLAGLLRYLAFEGWISTAHDLSEGGLALALAESCFTMGLGARVRVDATPMALFSETQARAFVAAPPKRVEAILEEAGHHGVRAVDIGEVGGSKLVIQADGDAVDAEVESLRKIWETALPRALEV